jgi:hypothetical protein
VRREIADERPTAPGGEADTIAEAANIRPAVQRGHGFAIGGHAVPAVQQVERLEAYR